MYAGEYVTYTCIEGLHFVPFGMEILPYYTKLHSPVSLLITNYRIIIKFYSLTSDQNAKPPISIPLMSLCSVVGGQCSQSALSKANETVRESLFLIRREEGKTLLAEHDHQISGGYGRGNSAAGPKVTIAGGLANHFFGSSNRGIDNYSSITGGVVNGSGIPWNSVTDGILSGMGLMDNTGDFDDSQLGYGQSAGSSALLQPKPLIWLDLFHKQPWVFRLAMGSTSTGHYSITTPASQSHNGHAITTTYSKKAPYCLLDLMKFIIMSVPETLGECFAFQHYAALRRGLWRICSMCGVLTGGIPSIAMQECQHGEKQRELMLSERNEGESKEHVSAAKEKDNNWLSSAYVNENTPKFTNPSVTHKLNDTDTNAKLYNSEDISIEGNRKIISPTANLKNSTVPSIMWLDPDLLPISASDGVYDDDKYNDLTDGLIRTSLGRFYLSGNTNINVDNNSTDLLSDTATPSLVIPFGFGLCAKLIIRPSLQPATPKSSHNSLSTPSGVGIIPTFMANVTSRDEKNISDCISTQKTDRSMRRPSNSILQQPTSYDSKNGSKNKPKRNTLETFEMRLAMSYLTNTIGEFSRDRQIDESPDWTIGGESRTARLSMVASHCCSAASVLRVRDAELQRQVTLLQEIQFSEELLGEDEQLVSEEKLTSTGSASVELLIPTPQHLLHIHRTCQTTQTHLDHFHRKIPQDQRVSATNIAKHDETGYAYAEDPRKRHHHPFYSGAWGNADVTDPSITPSDDGACNIGASKFRDATSDNDNDRGNRGSITVSIPQDYFLSLPDTSWGIFNIEREFFRQTLLGREVAENNIVGLGLNLTPFFRIMELSWGSEKDGGVVRRSCRGKVNGAAGETDGEVIEIQTTRGNDKLCQGVSPSVFSDSSIAIGDTVGVTKGVLNRSNGPSNIIRDVCIAVDCTESDTYFNPLSQYVVYSPVSNGPIKGPVKKPLHSVDGDFGNATICKSPILESSSSNSASSDNSSESSLIDILHKNISNISRDSHIIRIPSISYFKKIRSTFGTYPSAIVIPRICGSLHKQFDTILSAAKFRQNGRIPSISWIHLDTGASISRCSQPMVGMTGNNINDQLLCSYLNQSINSHYNQGEKEDSDSKRYPKKEREGEENKDNLLSEGRILHILDCRSSAAATANIAKGGGFELVQYYERAHIQFMSMDNIHAVRQSLEKVFKLCRATQHNDTGGVSSGALPRSKRTVLSSTSGTVGSGGVISAIGDVGDGGSGTGFFSRLESTYWPTLVQRMIWAGSQAAGYLQKGDSVLVHCTDGWDRTTQVVCIASILNDSHFRTVEGFCQLIQREWIEMGHRFAERCGHQRKVLGDFTKSMRDSLLEEAEEVLERAIDVDIERCMRKRGPKEQLRALDMVHKKGRNTLVDRKQTEETNIEKIGERCSDLSDVSITPIQDDIRCKEGVQGFNRMPSIKESTSQGRGISKYKEEKEDGSEEPIILTSKYNAVGDAENIEMLHICEETNERGMEDLKKASEEGLITEKSCEDSQLIQSQSTEDIFTSDGITRNDRNHKQISSENCKINMFGAFASEKEKKSY